MAVDVGALRRTLATYRGTGASSRAFVAARVAVAPLGALDPELRGLRGRVLWDAASRCSSVTWRRSTRM